MSDDIVYANGGSYVLMVSRGHYQVFQHQQTHAVRIGTYDFKDRPDYALQRAKQRCDEVAEL